MVEVRLTESPGCISGITRCSLSQGGWEKKKKKRAPGSLSFRALSPVVFNWWSLWTHFFFFFTYHEVATYICSTALKSMAQK